jgi:NitT/TauT family transport system substrate-binding protein
MSNMKKNIVLVLIMLICLLSLTGCVFGPSSTSVALEKTSLQLQWITQAQFAGYYVALDKGYYRDEGLDVEIKPGTAETLTANEVADGNSDFGTTFLADLTVAIQNGKSVVSIAQIQQMNGLLLIAKKSTDIRRPGDLKGKKIGIWGPAWETQLNALLARENIDRKDVQIVPQGYDIEPFLHNQLDVASAMVYNEYHSVLEAGMRISDINIIDFTLYGLGFPGDTLFTSRRLVQEKPDLCRKMLKASLLGWQYAIDNPKEAVEIVLRYDKSGTANRQHQLAMMREVAHLVRVSWRAVGFTDRTSVQQMVNVLMRYKVMEVNLQPEAIFTNDFWDQIQESN